MRRPLRLALPPVLLLLGAAQAAAAALPVAVTLHPLALVVREVGGEDVAVQVLVPPGASPHTFEPRPSDVARLTDAALFVRAGGGADHWAAGLADAAPEVPQLVFAEVLDARMPDVPRAHAWLDPLAVRDALAPAVAQRLAALDPERADAYRTRLADFQARLTALDREVRGILAEAPGRHFVALHAAWDAFARRYDLEMAGVVEAAPGQEPSPGRVAALVETARRLGVPAIVVEPQLSPRVARVIAAEFGGEVVTADPLGDPDDPERDTYAELVRFDARRFREAVGGGRP
ncbi:MAG: metal ABC transporter substrate-binding protein [Myxococcota bacterium]|nr:metal ABC transporter substrate-binding protein [Myxococcota bacterium]